MTEAANEVTEENLPDTGTVNNIEGASEAASFDELYERAMSPVIPGKGAAIFLHCMSGSYTAGCVAVPESDMLYILKRLKSPQNPIIIIE